MNRRMRGLKKKETMKVMDSSYDMQQLIVTAEVEINRGDIATN